MKVKLSTDFYDGEIKYAARDEGGEPLLHDFPEGMTLPRSAEIYDVEPAPKVKLRAREPDTLKALTEAGVKTT